MKKILLLFTVSLLAFASCETKKEGRTESNSTQSTTTVVNLNPVEFQEKGSNGIILDVRTPGEVAQGKIPGALAMDYYASDFLTKVNELPKDKEIYLYCAVGARSEEAAQLLIQQGFTKVYHLSGGIQAWAQSGQPIVQE
jgi:rhodanese-related sulfurtransferase